ncbi:hypothetical protein G9F73_002535 [Clostridium estertheticum]|uniref:hypothetical protein n=1 Tax=Clostridium estertheticum TaxID=238834 RepID=UPI001651C3A1|nr:hypothetical protein [Clostridium estertheticum]MBZ9606714.1 hypothetical protein [Clostridium estertheticum]
MKVYNLNELTDSRVLYDKNPPEFMIYIIALVTVLLVMFLVWSNKSAKTYMVKGQGIVITENKSQIMAAVSVALLAANATVFAWACVNAVVKNKGIAIITGLPTGLIFTVC